MSPPLTDSADVPTPLTEMVMSSAVVLWLRRARPEWGRRVWWLVGSTGAALLLVELPVYRRLQQQLTAYQGGDRASLADQWERVRTASGPCFCCSAAPRRRTTHPAIMRGIEP